jgi:UDP-N-acetylmuramoyl-tripeptide--D-alanyl-D-alanine ligase
VQFDPERGLDLRVDGVDYHLAMPGRHFLYSALPAIFLGRRCGVPEKKIAQALAAQKPYSMRGTIEKKNGVTFIVDCYNANPSSMKTALATLIETANPARRVAIVGDMLELGQYSKRLHTDLGRMLADCGVQTILAIGQFAQTVADGAVKAGIGRNRIFTAATSGEAVGMAKEIVRPGDVVLLKGSRGVHLETVFEKF